MTEAADRTESIFATAVALATATERAAYLDQACAGDAALRAGRPDSLAGVLVRRSSFAERPTAMPNWSRKAGSRLSKASKRGMARLTRLNGYSRTTAASRRGTGAR